MMRGNKIGDHVAALQRRRSAALPVVPICPDVTSSILDIRARISDKPALGLGSVVDQHVELLVLRVLLAR